MLGMLKDEDSLKTEELVATDQLYANHNHFEFTGPYSNYRRKMDAQYFVNYQLSRQEYQDQIISKYVSICPTTIADQSEIIFTHGPFGAGKSYVMRYLEQKGYLDLSQYIYIDPDQLKYELPEAMEYIKKDPKGAGTLLHMESTFLSQMLQYIILDTGRSMIIDGSMRDLEWHTYYIQWIREHYPKYHLSLIKVEADLDRVLQRCFKRGQLTGRIIPEDLIIKTISQTQFAFPKYAKLIPSCMIVVNNEQPEIIYNALDLNQNCNIK
jgi:hypothetical protein